MKCCANCGGTKPAAAFYADRSRSDGLSSRCRACITVERAAYRSANREKLRLQARADRRSTPERGCWQAMLARCYDPKNSHYAQYGGRGITVCDRWRGSFEAFLADMGPRPSLAHTVDREDTNGNYTPQNCRWATATEQGRNRRDNHLLAAFGKTQCIAAWAEELGIPPRTIRDRIGKLGWSVEQALSVPRLRKGQKPRAA